MAKHWFLSLIPLFFLGLSAFAQITPGPGVTVTGAVTPGDCASFASLTVIQDAGGACGGGSTFPSGTRGAPLINTSGSTTYATSLMWLDASQFPGSTVDAMVNACITQAIADAYLGCDARALYGNHISTATINVGDSSGHSVSLLLPQYGSWLCEITNGTPCIRQYQGTSIIGYPGSGISNLFNIQPTSGAVVNYIYTTDSVNSNAYYYASGFGIYNATEGVATTTGIAMYIAQAYDNSRWEFIAVQDNKDANPVYVYGACCEATLAHMQISGNYVSGSIPLSVVQDNSTAVKTQGFNIVDLTIVHPGAGEPVAKFSDTSTAHYTTVNLDHIYSETSNSDTTTAIYQFSGLRAVRAAHIDLHSEVASSTASAISIDNTYNTALTLNGLAMGAGAGTFTYPAPAVVNNYLSQTILTDSLGNLSEYSTGPVNFGAATTLLASPIVFGTTNAAYYFNIAASRAFMGYDGSNTFIQSAAGHGMTFYCNSSTVATGVCAVIGSSGTFGVGSNTTVSSDPFNVTSAGVTTTAALNSTGPVAAGTFVNTVTTVTASATPALVGTNGLQTITLNANATPTITGITAGQRVTFQICQPASGGPYTWAWPGAIHGGMTIGTTASTCSEQSFDSFSGTTLVAESTGVINIAP